MKKVLALVLSFALVFSTFGMAFADTTTTTPAAAPALSADATICADLGMLKGATGTVDAAYTATTPTKIQSAIMVLRLKGLEAEALAFTGTENFADAADAAWAKPVMAYLKAHPELGFVGSNNKFAPTANITAQQYYKVMLEALGYKQNTAEVVGDFTWDGTIAFAATKGLTKAAAATNFTIDNLAAATVETLKGAVKGGTTTLVATLVAAGKVDAAKATTAGIYTAAATTAAEVDTVKATANDKVEVAYTADVEKTFAETAANFKVTVKGSTTALEVKTAALSGTSLVVLTTAAQTGGTAYTLTIGDKTYNFAGVAKATATPEVDTVTSIDTNTIEVVFKNVVDRASAEDVANYVLNNGATVKKAELWIDQDDTRKTVKLTADTITNNKVYKLKVQNIKSADGVAMKSVDKTFTGITDTKAPTINTLTVNNNSRIVLVFTDNHGVDKATAEDVANYSVDGGLTVTAAKAESIIDAAGYGYLETVTLTTSTMEANKKYTLSISNLADGSVSKNVISKVLTKSFIGKAADTTAPKAGGITVLGDNMVEIDFSSETNRLDVASATDINNYTFNEGLKVLSAKIIRASKPDSALGKTVTLTTSTMDKDTTYKISVENVADEFGNVMTKVSNRALTRTTGADIAAPTVKTVAWTDLNTVVLTFNERLDSDSATDVANYAISGSLGAVVKAEISGSSGYTKVTLTTAKQAVNKKYTITINGVKDRVGNATSELKTYFTSGMEGADTTMPEVSSVSAISKNEIRVTFDEAVNSVTNSNNALTFQKKGTTTALTADSKGLTLDDETTVVYKTDAAIATTDEYEITAITNVSDKANNTYVVDATDYPTFYGNTTAADTTKVSTKDQKDAKTLVFTFDNPILYTGGAAKLGATDGTLFTATVDVDGDKTNDAQSTLTLEISGVSKLTVDKEYTFDFSAAALTDYLGVAVGDDNSNSAGTNTVYRTVINDEDKPVINSVEATDKTHLKVTFSEDTDGTNFGSYVIKNSSDVIVSGVTLSAPVIDADSDSIVHITLGGTALVGGDVYKLVPKTGAKDIAGNTLDVKDVAVSFVASDVVAYDYIKGVRIVDAKTIKISATKAINVGGASEVVKVLKADGTTNIFNSVIANDDTKEITVDLKEALLDGASYTVDISGGLTATFAITGVLTDGGIDIVDPAAGGSGIITFSGWNLTDFVVKVVYLGTSVTVTPGAANFVATVGNFAGVGVGATYTIEVYRTIAAGTPDTAVLYTKEFTKQ